MVSLTKELSQPSPVGTEIRGGGVVDTSVADFLQDVTATGIQARRTSQAVEERGVLSTVRSEIEGGFEEFGLEGGVTGIIKDELAPAARNAIGARQGRDPASKDRFITDMDARVRKLKARFPGHSDIIEAQARKILGFDPRKATLDIIFAEGNEAADENQRNINRAIDNGLTSYNVPGDPTSGLNTNQMLIDQLATDRAQLQIGAASAKGNAAGVSADKLAKQEAQMELFSGINQEAQPFLQKIAMFASEDFITEEAINASFVELKQSLRSSYQTRLTDPDLLKAANEHVDNLISTYAPQGLDKVDHLSTLNRMNTYMKAQGTHAIFNDMPTLAFLKSVAGEDGGGVVGSLMFNPEIRAKLEKEVREGNQDLSSDVEAEIFRVRNTLKDVMLGRYKADSPHLTPIEKEITTEQSWKALQQFAKKPTEDPEGAEVFANTVLALDSNYREFIQSDPENQVNLLNLLLDGAAIPSNIRNLKKNNPVKYNEVVTFISLLAGDVVDSTITVRGGTLAQTERQASIPGVQITKNNRLTTGALLRGLTETLAQRRARISKERRATVTPTGESTGRTLEDPLSRGLAGISALFLASEQGVLTFKDAKVLELNQMLDKLETTYGVDVAKILERVGLPSVEEKEED